MKKKRIITCILSLIMCASLLTGATYALFTDEDKTNIAITSGKIDVEASIDGLELYSPTYIGNDGKVVDKTNAATSATFANGGTATIEEGALTLTNVVPGDKASFKINVTNDSNVSAQYRTIINVAEDNGLFGGLMVIVGSAFAGNTSTEWTPLSVDEKLIVIDCSVELPTTVTEDYSGKTCKIEFTVEAVQGNFYPYEIVSASSQEQLDETIANVNEPTKIVLSSGEYILHNDGRYAGKEIVIEGTTDVTIDCTGLGNELYGDKFIFNNVKMNFPDVSHKGLTHTNKIIYNNCTFSGTQTLYAPEVEFNNCKFEGNDGKDIYYVWTYGIANVTFNNCVFNTNGKAILCYTEGVTVSNITLNGCTFNSDGTIANNKAAVEVGTDNHAQIYKLFFTNCTQNGFATNNSNDALWGNKNSMTINELNVIIDGEDVY